MRAGWYVQRLRRMSLREVGHRAGTRLRQRRWARAFRRPEPADSLLPGRRVAGVALPRSAVDGTSPAAAAVVAAADALLAGRWPLFHLPAAEVGPAPDWFRDPLTGTSAPRADYAFDIPYRDEASVGNIKFVWEMSRHQATTMLASAWLLTGRSAYAEGVAAHLTSWWRDNPFLSGVHWTSAIEVGIRLLSWTWIRALLADWPGVRNLFDDNDVFAGQLFHHQLYVRTFHSQGSSANNHLVAELSGLSAAAVAFPWFRQSHDWAAWSRAALVKEAATQTHPDGLNREQASEYHLFVWELLLAAVLPARMAGQPFPPALDQQLCRMADAWAASLDATGRPPRYGDGDEGRGLLLDAPGADHTSVVLDTARALYGAAPWWPAPGGSVLGQVAAFLAPHPPPAVRTVSRPCQFAGTGMTILRSGTGADELWLRCDAGPLGFLSIAAHGHADALSVELRCGGTDILADPGTYCYHGEPDWRRYFKGTAAHNTLTVDDVDQAVNAGPFLWLAHTDSRLADVATQGPVLRWEASHLGYRRLADPVTHHRRVELDTATCGIIIRDRIDCAASHDVLLAFHLGPEVAVALEGAVAHLRWPGGAAALHLAPSLQWRVRRGEQAPPFGWYSHGFGHRVPASSLAGTGRAGPGAELETRLTVVSTNCEAQRCRTLIDAS